MTTASGKTAEQRIAETERRDVARKKHNLVNSEIPKRYQDSDDDQFPPQWEQIRQWVPNDQGQGLILFGPKGKGKTRMLCKLAIDLQDTYPIRFAYETSCNLGKMVRRQYQRGDESAMVRIDFLHRVPLLILDDLGKQANSPTVEEELFNLIDTRISEMRATLISTNLVSEELQDSMSGDIGGPLVRRIRDFCDSVIVK